MVHATKIPLKGLIISRLPLQPGSSNGRLNEVNKDYRTHIKSPEPADRDLTSKRPRAGGGCLILSLSAQIVSLVPVQYVYIYIYVFVCV